MLKVLEYLQHDFFIRPPILSIPVVLQNLDKPLGNHFIHHPHLQVGPHISIGSICKRWLTEKEGLIISFINLF